MTRTLKTTKEEEDQISKDYNDISEIRNKKLLKSNTLRSKVFNTKNSILTELLETKHGATVYNLFSTILFSLFINALIYNYLYHGEIKLGFSLLVKGYSKLHVTMTIWLGMIAASFLCYYGFKIWALRRIKLAQNSIKVKLWDQFMIGLGIIYYSLFLYCPPLFIRQNEIPIASAVMLLMENVRMLMIFYSFIRNNTPRVLNHQKGNESIVIPNLYNFAYFYFAPTLIYQDVYPRSKNRNWKIIFRYAFEFFGVILLLNLLLEDFYLNLLADFGLRPYATKEIIIFFFKHSMIGLLVMFSFFYIILHIWMNTFAELMMFSDRTFYEDWWTSHDYEKYYRTCNVLVHDWLYIYVYKDFYEHVYSRSKIPAKFLVLVISAIFHEYILGFSFGFCLPVLSVQFILVGVPYDMLQIKANYIANVLFLYVLGLGNSIVIGVYTMEYYSRLNCPIENFTVYDYFIPHFMRCNNYN